MARTSSSRKKRKGIDLTKPVEHPRMPFAVLFRMFVIGALGVVAAGYAIYRHYTFTRPSMLEAVPSATAGPWLSITDLVPDTPSASASASAAPPPPASPPR